ncbi:MAG: carbohydrate ABC transporter permease [Lachnospiraceae bacterium]|jgi:raffinose/stachyose/melibiose transport system permease protein|nr:carbohydrate ABC transporter permease [Lachnospiraceae bacterium]
MKHEKTVMWIKFAVILILALIFIYPMFLVFINSVKPLKEIIANPLSLPGSVDFDNYVKTWGIMDIPKIVRNTAVITIFSLAGIIMLTSMTAYWTVRHPTKYSRIFNGAVLLSALVPFAAIMIPEIQVLHTISLINTLPGTILVYWGIGIPFAFFIIQSAVKGLPVELEESAMIDGCSRIGIFFKIVLPLLKPAITTVAVMDIFWIWNDFMVPLITLNNGKMSTIQLAISKLFGQYSSKWDIALPALVITLIPILVVFIVLQKRIVDGITAGAVKG